jgi:hypothetical protein
LDLFLCSFVRYGPPDRFACGDNKLGRKYYCIPRVFKPTPSLHYRNNGDGTFKLVTGGTDIEKPWGRRWEWLRRISTMTDGQTCLSPTIR